MATQDIVVRKPRAMIQTSVKGLTLTQRKTINALIYIAQRAGERKWYSLATAKLKQMCGISTTGNEDLKEQLRELTEIRIEFNSLGKENEAWEVNALLAGAKMEPNSETVEFAFSPFLQDRILNPAIFAPLSIQIIARFDSSYTVVLYEFLRDYLNAPKIPLLTIDDFRRLMGVGQEKYNKFKDFRRRVLDPAVFEVNEKTDIHCNYELIRKNSKKYGHIQFSVRKNENPVLLSSVDEIPPEVLASLPEFRRTSAVIDVLRPYCFGAYDPSFLISNIRYSLRHARENFPHYLSKALTGDYAGHDREEADLRQSSRDQEDLKRLKAERDAIAHEHLGESLYDSLDIEALLRYTDQVRLELKAAGIASRFITEAVIKARIIEKLVSEYESNRAGVQENLFS